MTSNKFNVIKCVIIGDTDVGKTSIIQKFIKPNYNKTDVTLGAIFWTLDKIIDDVLFKLNLWDTAGQERYNSLIPMYTRDSDIVIITFDLTNKESFNNLNRWIKHVNDDKRYNIPKLIIIGNKSDKICFRQINRKDINTFLLNKNLDLKDEIYFESSAKTGENINTIFNKIFKLSYDIAKEKRDNDTNRDVIQLVPPKNTSYCNSC